MAAYEPVEVVYMTNTEGTANKVRTRGRAGRSSGRGPELARRSDVSGSPSRGPRRVAIPSQLVGPIPPRTDKETNKYYKVEFFEEDLWGVTFDEQEGIWPEGKDKTKDGSDKGPKVFAEGTVEEWNGRYAFRSESAAAACKAVDKLVKSKKKKGYVEDDEPEE